MADDLSIAPQSEQLAQLVRVASSSESGAMTSGLQNLAGGRVRKLRATQGLSQEQLAARCQTAGWDVSRGTLAKIESGVRRLNDAEVVILALALRLSVSELLEGFPQRQALAVVRHGQA